MRVGQSVLYKPSRGERYFGMELAAIVTRVVDRDRVNLAIFDPFGNLITNPPMNVMMLDLMPVVSWANESSPPPIHGDITGELPPGAKVVEQRPATPEEVAVAKGAMAGPIGEALKSGLKKPVKK